MSEEGNKIKKRMGDIVQTRLANNVECKNPTKTKRPKQPNHKTPFQSHACNPQPVLLRPCSCNSPFIYSDILLFAHRSFSRSLLLVRDALHMISSSSTHVSAPRPPPPGPSLYSSTSTLVPRASLPCRIILSSRALNASTLASASISATIFFLASFFASSSNLGLALISCTSAIALILPRRATEALLPGLR